jgi:hypothetical protein
LAISRPKLTRAPKGKRNKLLLNFVAGLRTSWAVAAKRGTAFPFEASGVFEFVSDFGFRISGLADLR